MRRLSIGVKLKVSSILLFDADNQHWWKMEAKLDCTWQRISTSLLERRTVHLTRITAYNVSTIVHSSSSFIVYSSRLGKRYSFLLRTKKFIWQGCWAYISLSFGVLSDLEPRLRRERTACSLDLCMRFWFLDGSSFRFFSSYFILYSLILTWTWIWR